MAETLIRGKLTPPVAEAIVRGAYSLLEDRHIAELVGVRPETLAKWLEIGAGELARFGRPATRYGRLKVGYDMSRAKVHQKLTNPVFEANDWRASIAALERLFPERWAKRGDQAPTTVGQVRIVFENQTEQILAARQAAAEQDEETVQ